MKCLTCKQLPPQTRLALPFLLFAGGCVGVALGDDAERKGNRQQRITPTVRVFQAASPAVVNLSTKQVVTIERPFGIDPFFQDIFDFPIRRRPRKYETQSVGSGFILHGDGYIVTNGHVVDRATECRVTLADGTEMIAEEVAIDRRYDLAVLKVEPKRPLPHIQLGRSDDLMQGETVVVIGNPLGYGHTVTTGVISALDRDLVFDQRVSYEGLIQTDASINPGNSGGPVLNINGELIGISTAIRGDAQNIGFAIPVDRLHALLPEMLDIERLRRVNFGVHFDSEAATGNNGGVRVHKVDPDTPASRAGVQPGDVVVAIDNQPTPTFMHAFSLLDRTPTGQSLKLDVLRKGGARKSFEVELAELPRLDPSDQLKNYFGIEVRQYTKADLRRLGLTKSLGLIITRVDPASQAARRGLVAGDVLEKFGGWPVRSLDRLGYLLKQVVPGDRIPFQVLRINTRSPTRFELGLTAR